MKKMRSIGLTLALTGLIYIGGCSAGTKPIDMGGADGSAVATLIEDMNDAKNNAKKLAVFFVTKPPDSKEMNKFAFYVKGKPTVDGTKAVCNVFVETTDGKPIGEKQWEFEKVAEAWKIKSAPVR